MRKVIVSTPVQTAIEELRSFLSQEYKMSRAAANARIKRIYARLAMLRSPGDTALCRSRKWHTLGYHCISFERWVFAYEVVPEGVIVRDMTHSSLIADVVY
jgi:hypothetical protein